MPRGNVRVRNELVDIKITRTPRALYYSSMKFVALSNLQTTCQQQSIIGLLYYYDQFGRGWDMGQAGRNLDVGHLEGGQGTRLDFGQSKGSATCSMLLCGKGAKSSYTL